MDRVATTFRIEPRVKQGLTKLGKFRKLSLNQMANETIKDYIAREMEITRADLESTLAELRNYQQSDPDFERAMAEFVDAEVSAGEDPVEGDEATAPGRTEAAILKVLEANG